MSTAYSSMNSASGLSQTNGAGLKYKKLNDSKPLGGNKSQNGMKTNGNTQATPTTTTATKAVGSKLEEQFKAACDAIQNLPKNGPFQPSNEMLLKFYAYFKQATVGPANSSRPSMFKVVERAKYDAWNSVRHLNREEAMQGYIDEIKNIIETMPHSEHVEKLLRAIGPFYEYVNEDSGHDEENEEEEDDDDDEEDDDDEDEEVARNNTSGEGCNGGGGEADAVTTSMSSCIMVASTASSVVEPLEYKPNGAAKFNGGGGGASHHVNGGSNHLKKLNGDTSLGLLNGSASSSNDRDYPSDDEEDYCDTSDIIIDAKQAEAAKARLNGNHLGVVDDDSATQLELLLASTSSVANRWNGANNEAKGDHQNGAFRPIVTNTSSASRSANESGLGLGTINGNSAVSTAEDSNHSTNCGVAVVENRFGIYKCGGETNSPQSSGLPYGGGGSQQASRQSRPGSSMSQSNMPGSGYPDRRSYGGGAGGAGSGGGSGGGGNPTTSDYLMAQETNRQILLILVRLREDTNNVLTRLSFLESSVVSLQTNLQMNGGGFQQLINNNNGAGHSRSVALNRNPNNANSGGFFYSLVEFVRTIDWKTVTIAMLWPFIIRLVFYFFKKCRVVLKLKRIRN